MRSSRVVIIALGGSLLVPKEGIIDNAFITRFKKFILAQVKKGKRFVIITGGGRTARLYQKEAKKITPLSDEQLDWIGIGATKLNAELLRAVFGEVAYKNVCDNPQEKIIGKPKIVIASGWKPGCSTDYDAVLWAKAMDSHEIIDAGNIAFVYDVDPKLARQKKRKPVAIRKISWKEYRAMIQTKWSPGLSAPFDPVASKAAEKLGVRCYIIHGADLGNMRNILEGKAFEGTLIE
jgi:uridylate kinase